MRRSRLCGRQPMDDFVDPDRSCPSKSYVQEPSPTALPRPTQARHYVLTWQPESPSRNSSAEYGRSLQSCLRHDQTHGSIANHWEHTRLLRRDHPKLRFRVYGSSVAFAFRFWAHEYDSLASLRQALGSVYDRSHKPGKRVAASLDHRLCQVGRALWLRGVKNGQCQSCQK